MNDDKRKYFTDRKNWRAWLQNNHERETEVWLVNPNKSSGKTRIQYNDAVEEALCFGWIDSTVKKLDDRHSMQRFTPRNPKSSYSQSNKERLKWLSEKKLIHPSFRKAVDKVIREEFVYPLDILDVIRNDPQAWKNYKQFSESYKRIRIAYIDGARKRPEEFNKRLSNFIKKTRENKLIPGHGGIDKYY